jgi:hypothetical protein
VLIGTATGALGRRLHTDLVDTCLVGVAEVAAAREDVVAATGQRKSEQQRASAEQKESSQIHQACGIQFEPRL